MTRCIIYGNSTSTGVYFTNNMVADAKDFVPERCVLVSDFQITVELPAEFPVDCNLEVKKYIHL